MTSTELNKLTVPELTRRARSAGIPLTSNLRKADLVELLLTAGEAAASGARVKVENKLLIRLDGAGCSGYDETMYVQPYELEGERNVNFNVRICNTDDPDELSESERFHTTVDDLIAVVDALKAYYGLA